MADGTPADLDQLYAADRAHILGQPQDAEDGLMQAKARAVGQQCDIALDPASPAPSVAEESVKAAVRSYIQAVLDDDGKAACGLLTPDAIKAFTDKVGATTRTNDCATAFRQEGATLTDSEKAVYRSAVLQGVTINGDSALVTVQFTGVNKDISLRKVSGDWKISTGPGTG
jgi:hypothetical protein